MKDLDTLLGYDLKCIFLDRIGFCNESKERKSGSCLISNWAACISVSVSHCPFASISLSSWLNRSP